MYVNDLSDTPPQTDIAAYLNSKKAGGPHGTVGFEAVRGGTARKFVEVFIDIDQDLGDYQRRFTEWLGRLAKEGMPADWVDIKWYTFQKTGSMVEPT